MYKNKYKDRSPEETIKLIYDFFTSKNFEVKIDFIKKSLESGTWTSTINLFYQQNKILSANGKGTSKEFCLASGFGELYERFCNKIFILNNPFAMEKYLNNFYLNNNYYLDKNEKLLNENEVFASFKFKDYLEQLGGNYIYLLRQYYNIIHNNRYIGVPFKNVLNQEECIYLDPRILSNVVGSSGMCAGNSFKEAFNQGFSEILEHYLEGIFRYKEFLEYKVLDLSLINNKTILNIVQKIKENGNEIFVIDFSYNIDFPVLMVFLLNKETQMITKNIGCFPVFEIALERCLTELYQGDIDKLKFLKTEGFIPYKTECVELWENLWPGTPSLEETFPEFILKNLSFNNVPNKNVFLFEDNNISNDEIFEYYLELCRNKDLQVYFWNNSQLKEIYSLQIYVDNLSGLNYRQSSIKKVKNKQKILEFALSLFKFLNNNLNNNNIDIEEFKKIIKTFINFDLFEKNCVLNCLFFNNWFEPYESSMYITFNFFDYILSHKYDGIKNKNIFGEIDNEICLSKIAKKYLLLERYLLKNNYSNDEILFFINFLGIEINQDDIKTFGNKEKYILEYFKLIQTIYNSKEYIEYLNNI